MITTILALMLAPADPIGNWRTPRGAVIRVERCGAALCGRIVSLRPIPGNAAALDTRNRDAALRTRPLKGLAILTGLTGGPAKWSGGRVYNPEDGGSYAASAQLADARTFKVKGCLAAFLCRTQTWVRVD